ncbi:hypothetical protein E1B28_005811 [Marasmius oreades]|uniref:RRM Nup35-type domain-containing protein n=1 Tax=Marasmius oreades TaxID=181124 RepID=A0A9P7S4M5_9AGAR|nr:uncharacterized protein E1B28_005811 [Marasmius oreades]KAG7095017.1 hypothetical protein E1B28_005811 [Marasmius oreades]
MHNSTFSVAGMSSSTSSHNASLNSWGNNSTSTALGGSLSASFGDSLSQSRSHYQPGYLMSASQVNASPQGNQRVDEAPVVPTKAKMNHSLLRGSTSEFGMDSMFESTRARQRQTLPDEDAPPTSSVNDIPNEIHFNSARSLPRNTLSADSPFSRRSRTPAPSSHQSSSPLYVVVFGYPQDKYSVTVEYFKSLGDSTDPESNNELVNCFRIGYNDPGDAMRAVRKNGEILGGSWMVGAKWADPAQAETVLGQPVARNGYLSQPESTNSSNAMQVDEIMPPVGPPTFGTPLKLAPSTSAFRRTAPGGAVEKPQTPQPSRVNPVVPPPQSSPSKGIVGQVSDMIFGW